MKKDIKVGLHFLPLSLSQTHTHSLSLFIHRTISDGQKMPFVRGLPRDRRGSFMIPEFSGLSLIDLCFETGLLLL